MNKKIIIILFLASTAVLATVLSYAMDYPHNASKSVGCEDCHYIWGSEPSLMIEGLSYGNNIDDTQYNSLCWSCHQPLDATPVETHSSLQTDNGYGDWSFECIECHDVHGNYQFRTYGGSSYIAQDTVAAVNATTLTRTASTPVWADDQFQGMLLVPNIAYDYNNYLITGNDNTTITVEGTIDISKVTALVDTFAVVYSNMVKSTIATPNSGNKTVKLFNSDGPNSFADADAAYDGVCEVCHTQTTYHRNDATADHTHNAGLDCMTCHQHTKGFKAACDMCHGNPPTVNTATGGPDGLANDPGVTGSSTAGAHNVHVNTKSFACTVCHYNSAGTGATHNNALTVTMGFYLFNGAEQGGSYDGQSGVSYNATTTSPVTSISSNGNKTCSSIYCHSTGQSTASGNSSTPTYVSPVWDTPASGACGTCHKVSEGAGLSSGSHEAHLETTGVAGCAECHTGAENDASAYNSSNHINSTIEVANAYDAGGSLGNGYGKCSTGRCHDDGLGNAKSTPFWGDPGAGCSECHVEVPATGSHVKHVTTTIYNTADCGDCHDGAVKNTTAPAQHIDGNVDVYDSSAGDLGYSQDVAKGGAPYDSCSTAYCHSAGQSTTDGSSSTPTYATVTWGATAACGTCHEVSVGSVTSGSHNEHLNATGVNGCGDCHTDAADNASSYNSSSHVDGSIDVANTYSLDGTPGNGYGTCSAASCHDDGTGTLTVTPDWGTVVNDCSECHANQPATGSHTNHLTTASGHGYKRPACGDCHGDAVQGTTAPAQHHDGNIDVYDTSAGDLGYPQDEAKGGAPYANCTTAYCHSSGQSYTDPNDATPTYATPTWGGGEVCGSCHKAETTHNVFADVIDSGSHTKHLSYGFNLGGSASLKCTVCHKWEASQAFGACNQCHGTAGANTYHANGEINVYLDTEFGPRTAYGDQTGTPGNGYYSCSNVYCHSTGQSTTDGNSSTPSYTTPTWGNAASAACGTCHEVNVGSLTSGSHDTHLNAAGVNGCGDCHTGAANDGSSYNDLTNHVDKSIDVANTYSAGGIPGNGYGTCSAALCHGSSSDTWGTDLSLFDTCTKCHGEQTVTPTDAQKAPGGSGVDTNGDSAASDAQVGAHQAHMTLPSGYTNQLNSTGNCNECHKVPSAAGDAGHIDSALPAEVYPGTINPEKADLNSVSPIYASGTCTVYCHGANMPGGSNNGSDTAPEWNQTGYLSEAPGDNNDGSGDCEKCHGAPPNTASHSGSETLADCDTCHQHFNNDGTLNNVSLHIDGTVQAATDCDSCHTGVPGGASYVTRDIVGSDFIQSSRHVFGGTVTNWDCIVCHREGDATAASAGTVGITSLHGNGGTPVVDMRNVDSINTGWTWDKYDGTCSNTSYDNINDCIDNSATWSWNNSPDDQMHTDMDSFCMGCHDIDGASGINVKATDDGVHLDSTRSMTPFNSTDGISSSPATQGGTAWQSAYERTEVVDVESQFNTANPSHHAVLGQAYSATSCDFYNAGDYSADCWGTAAWVNRELKGGDYLVDQPGGGANDGVFETANLHCADCHTVDYNAHGGAEGFMLEAASIDDTCWLCHNASVYSDTANNAVPTTRWKHGNEGTAFDEPKGAKIGQYGANGGSICLNCHGGDPVNDGFGGIHGLPYDAAACEASPGTGNPECDPRSGEPRYRFQGGAYMSHSPGSWTGTSGSASCYFAGASKNQDWSSCSKHDGPETNNTAPPQYSRGVPGDY